MSIPDSNSVGYTQSELAEVLGVKVPLVNREINKPDGGKLRGCLVDLNAKPRKVRDLAEAVRVWRANTDHTDAPQRAPASVDPDDTSLANAAARAKHWEAQSKELKYRQEAKELVLAAEVEAEWAKILGEIRTKLLGVPTRVKQAAPHLAVADVVLVENLIREALQGIGEE